MTRDINKLPPNALKAAMRTGNAGWGSHGNSTTHARYLQETDSRKRCGCGCKQRASHLGMANGVALASGCELRIRRWIKEGALA